MEKNNDKKERGSILYILGYPLQEQIDVGHLDVLMEMYKNALKTFDDVHLVSPRDNRAYNLGKNINVHSFRKWFPRPIQIFIDGFKVSRIVAREDVRVVRALAIGSGFTAYLNKRLSNTPYILSVHGDRRLLYEEEGIKRNPVISALEDWIQRIALRNASVVPVISDYIKSYAIKSGANPNRIIMHQNFVDTDIFRPIKKNNKIKLLVFVGRLEIVKGVDILIRAMPSVVKNIRNVELLIVGDGPQKESLKHLADELGLKDYVKFLGSVKHDTELPKVLANSDVFVAPLTAGFTLIEAMSCGLPVVAADIEWSKEVVTKDRGILVKAKVEEELVIAITRILGDPKLSENMGKSARSFIIRNFSLDSWKNREIAIYDTVKR